MFLLGSELFLLLLLLISLLLLLILALLTLRLLALAEYFLEVAHLREVHVTECPSGRAVAADIIGPERICQQLIRLSLEFFHRQQMSNQLPGVRLHRLTQRQVFALRSRQSITQSISNHAVIVRNLGFEIQFLQR